MEDAFTRSLGLLMTLSVPPCVLLATLAAPLIRASTASGGSARHQH